MITAICEKWKAINKTRQWLVTWSSEGNAPSMWQSTCRKGGESGAHTMSGGCCKAKTNHKHRVWVSTVSNCCCVSVSSKQKKMNSVNRTYSLLFSCDCPFSLLHSLFTIYLSDHSHHLSCINQNCYSRIMLNVCRECWKIASDCDNPK